MKKIFTAVALSASLLATPSVASSFFVSDITIFPRQKLTFHVVIPAGKNWVDLRGDGASDLDVYVYRLDSQQPIASGITYEYYEFVEWYSQHEQEYKIVVENYVEEGTNRNFVSHISNFTLSVGSAPHPNRNVSCGKC